jgi:large conductance mechanosensitive channel
MGIIQEFKEFIAQGNFIDLAIGVLIGGAFGPVVNAFVTDFIMNIIAAIFGQPNFDSIGFNIGGDTVPIGDGTFGGEGTRVIIGTTITALIRFLIIMLVAFLILKAMAKFKKAKEEAPAGPSEVDLLTEIRDSLRAR